MEVPVVLFHKSEKYYVSCALRAAKKRNNDVTLISDVRPDIYTAYSNVIDINFYKNDGAVKFAEVYQHLSTNSHNFEFTAIEKYFFLLEHMKKNKLKKILYIDSDLLLYDNMSTIINKYYDSYDLCSCIPKKEYSDLVWTASGHLSLWSYTALNDFCEFIINLYTNQIDLIKKKWQWHLDNNITGGICDMTLIYLFQYQTQLKSGNFLEVVDNRFSFDYILKSSTGEFDNEYDMENSFILGDVIKKVSFKDGYPYCYNKLLKKDILLYSLHCQAEAKRIMPLLVKDNKNLKEFIFDNLEIFKFFYGSLKKFLYERLTKFYKTK